MTQLFAGVNFLHHTLGVAHRDLSLENVLMRNDQCKISDFGLSVGISERCIQRVGKNYYMAPEVVAGEEYNPVQADIWSLGIIWFILLTGSPLISIASRQNKAFTALEQCGVADVFVSWKCNDKLSTPVIELISQMLKIDPAERISIKEILEHPALN
ncbi:CAMK protein kinase [Phytophthora megakarya]|uniref:CAMK protein kinase n=1 Tax=Phytophthora megakarya TaxID=4795 RepID=A0A225V7J6_9STRA|nr:CAMK protein kinase [Phytophthora megakarya]